MKFYFYDRNEPDWYILIGEKSFNSFYPSDGYEAFLAIAEQKPELLEDLIIVDEQAKTYTLDSFLGILEFLRIIEHGE